MRPVYSNGSTVHLSGIGQDQTLILDHGNTVGDPTTEDSSFRLDKVLLLRPGWRIKGLYGYNFHDSCWCLLEICYPGQLIPLERLLYVFESVPYFKYPSDYRLWGHNYGGLLLFNRRSATPWRYDLMVSCLASRAARLGRDDPFSIFNTQQFLSEHPQLPPEESIHFTVQSRPLNDCFSRIPQEIVDEIIMYVPTADALRCRLVSRALGAIVSSQRFWASRFEPCGEYGFLFEVQPVAKSPRDWRSLYLCMRETNIPDILWNGKRIWKLNRLLVGILSLKWRGIQEVQRAQQEQPNRDPFSVWEEVSKIQDGITNPR